MKIELTEDQKLEFLNKIWPEVESQISIATERHFVTYELGRMIRDYTAAKVRKVVEEIALRELEKRKEEIEKKTLKHLEATISSIWETVPSIVFHEKYSNIISEVLSTSLKEAQSHIYKVKNDIHEKLSFSLKKEFKNENS